MRYGLKYGGFTPMVIDDPGELKAILTGLLWGTRKAGDAWAVGTEEAINGAADMVGRLTEHPEMVRVPLVRCLAGGQDIEIWIEEGDVP